jgi:hypothetical protein
VSCAGEPGCGFVSSARSAPAVAVTDAIGSATDRLRAQLIGLAAARIEANLGARLVGRHDPGATAAMLVAIRSVYEPRSMPDISITSSQSSALDTTRLNSRSTLRTHGRRVIEPTHSHADAIVADFRDATFQPGRSAVGRLC